MNKKQQQWLSPSLPLIAVLLMLASACSDTPASYKGRLAQKNVLVISIDTCRADHLGAYGGTQAKTPALDAFAREGALFTDAVSPVPMTLPAHASLMTGLHPVQTQVRDNFNAALSDGAVTLAELFQESSYRTGGIIGAILLSRRSGLSQGFDQYEDQFTQAEFSAIQPTVERKADRVAELARVWLDSYRAETEKKPFFLFLHFYDPHMLYQPPSPFREEYKDKTYAGEIAYVDSVLGQLFDYLKQNDLYNETLVWVLADHGEGLGDHGEETHGLFLYEETVRVPMLVKLPQSANAKKKRIDQTASLLDVMPTLIEICGLGPVPSAGQSLAPWLLGAAPAQDRRLTLETQYPLTYQWSPLFALREQPYKYIQAPKSELYSLEDDPKEKSNLLADQPLRGDSMRKALEEDLLNLAKANTLSPEAMASSDRTEALTSLGYVAPAVQSTTQPVESLPDPKDKLQVYNLVDYGLGAAAAGNYPRAIQLFEQAIQQDPGNPTPYMNLGLVYSRQNNWIKAQILTEMALQRAPGSVLVRIQLARIVGAQKKYAKAREILLELINENPRMAEAHLQLGQIDYQEKKYPDALQRFEEAKRWMPDLAGLDAWIERVKNESGG